MITVGDLLRAKGGSVWFVTPKTTVIDALKYLAEKDIGALVVMENEKLAGIISERDFARMIAASGNCQVNVTIKNYMTIEVFTVTPKQTIDECMKLMTEHHIRHLPVLEEDKLIGVISIGDVVKGIIVQQGQTIEDLKNYIEGRGFGQ